MMEIRHLRYFVALADELHFGRAARRLHMAQPPLSARIADLERELGTALFTRTSRRVELTAAGQHLLPRARAAIAAFDTARGALGDAGFVPAPTLRVGLPPETDPETIKMMRKEMRRSDPETALSFREACTAEQLPLLRTAELDVGLLRHPFDDRQLEIAWVLQRPLGVALHAHHPLARRSELSLSDLDGQTLIIFPRDGSPGLYDYTLDTCRAHGYIPRHIEHALRLVQGLLADREAVMLAAEHPTHRAGLTWRPLTGNPLRWRTSLVWRTGAATSTKRHLGHLTARALRRCESWQTTG